MQSKKVKLIISSIIILLWSIWVSTFALIVPGPWHSTLEECNKAKERWWSIYTEFKRSECYKDRDEYRYNLCSKDVEKCNVKWLNKEEEFIWLTSDKCSIGWWENKYIKWKLKEKVDKALEELDDRAKRRDKLINWYALGTFRKSV